MNELHPEVDEYRNNPWGMSAARRDGVGSGGYVTFTPKILADAAIAALEVRVAELEDQLDAAKVKRQRAEQRAERAEAELG